MTPDDGFPLHWGKPPPGSSHARLVLERAEWIKANERADAEHAEHRGRVSGRAALATVAARRYDPYIDDD